MYRRTVRHVKNQVIPGDCQVYIHTAMYLMDCYPVYAKWIREQAAGQYKDGVVPQIATESEYTWEKEKSEGIDNRWRNRMVRFF